MEFQSCFDIIGPIMVGPSSSHTAGAVSIGRFVHELLDGNVPQAAKIILYDSFAQTYRGHGTDKALIGGLIGIGTDDPRIRNAIEMANQQGMHYAFELEDSCPYYNHPNTVVIEANNAFRKIKVGGVSLGGGLSKIFLVNEVETNIRLSTEDDLRALCKRLPSSYFQNDSGEV